MRFSPFLLLCSTGLLAIFSSTISKSPVLPLFASHLGADPAWIGIIASVSAFTGIVVSIPAGIMSDRLGRKKMLIFAGLVFSTAPFLYLIATQVWQLVIIRFYHGLATAIFIPVAMAMVADIFHKERGEKIGWFSTSTLLGRFMAPIAGGSIIGVMVLNPNLGFKGVYVVCGVAGVLAMLLVFKLPDINKNPHEEHRWRNAWFSFKEVIANKKILLTSAVEAAILFAYGTFETFLPIYSVSAGLSAYEIGIFLSSQVITLALTKPAMGRFSDRHGRKPQIFIGALTGAACISSLFFFKSFLPLLLLSILFGLSLSIVTSATSAFIADLSRRETHGSAMGILGSIMDIGHTTGPLVSGIIALHFGLGISFIGAGIVLAVAAFLFLISMRNFQML